MSQNSQSKETGKDTTGDDQARAALSEDTNSNDIQSSEDLLDWIGQSVNRPLDLSVHSTRSRAELTRGEYEPGFESNSQDYDEPLDLSVPWRRHNNLEAPSASSNEDALQDTAERNYPQPPGVSRKCSPDTYFQPGEDETYWYKSPFPPIPRHETCQDDVRRTNDQKRQRERLMSMMKLNHLLPPAECVRNQTPSLTTDQRLKNLCSSTATLIGQEDSNDYVSTYAERTAFKLLKDFGFIFVKGRSGSGKSRLGLRLLSEMKRHQGRTPVVITSPEQWHLIPKAQYKNVSSTGMDSKSRSTSRYVVMIDDIFGSSNLVQSYVDEWTRMFSIMWPSVESGDILLVITSRPEISFMCKHKVNGFKFFAKMFTLTLDQGRYSLREGEKRRMLRTMCGKTFTDDDIECIVGMQTALGFPQCCKYFAGCRKAQRIGTEFFQKPHDFLLEEVHKIIENDGLGYLVLLLVMMEKGFLDVSAIDPFNGSSTFWTMVEKLRQLCVDVPTIPTLAAIRNKAESLCGGFLSHVETGYGFQHQSVFDSVFLSVSRIHPDICLMQCPAQIIMELVRTQNHDNEKMDMTIYLTQAHYGTFAKRVTELILSEEYYVRVGFCSRLKEYNTVHEANLTNTNSNIIEHPSLQDQSFLQYLVDIWRTDDKIIELLGKVYQKNTNCRVRMKQAPFLHALLSDTLLFEVSNFLGYMIFKKNVTLSKILLSKCSSALDKEHLEEIVSSSLPSAIYTSNNDMIELLFEMGASLNEGCFRALCAADDVDVEHMDRIFNFAIKCSQNNPLTVLTSNELHWDSMQNLKDYFFLAVMSGSSHVVKWMVDRLKHCQESMNIFSECLDVLFQDVGGNKRYRPYDISSLTDMKYSRSSVKSHNMTHVGEITHILLNTGCEINADYLLLLSAAHPDATALKIILKLDVNMRSECTDMTLGNEFSTPLEQAVAYGGVECLQELLRYIKHDFLSDQRSVKPGNHPASEENYRSEDPAKDVSCTANALQISVSENVTYEEMLEYFLYDSEETIQTLPHLAALYDNKNCLNLLLQIGFPVNLQNRHGDTPLHQAAKYNHQECVKLLLENKASVNIKNSNMDTPLMLVGQVTLMNTDIITELLAAGSDVDQPDGNGRTLLYRASESGQLEFVRMLLSHGSDVNVVNKQRTMYRKKHRKYKYSTLAETAVHAACRSADFETMKFLCKCSNRLDITDNTGKTLVHKAAESMSDAVEKVHYLLDEKHMSVDTEDCYGRTALFGTLSSGDSEVFELLIDRGLNVKKRDMYGRGMLFYAMKSLKADNKHCLKMMSGRHQVNPRLSIIRKLIQKGIDTTVVDKYGRTILHAAVSSQNQEVIKLLPTIDVHLHAQDNDGKTPLHIAASNETSDIVKLLMDKGASTSVKDQRGRTPLHYGAQNNTQHCLKILTEKGSDICSCDHNGQTPLHVAAKCGVTDNVKLLINEGADVNIKDKSGKTPLHVAKGRKLTAITALLIEKSSLLNERDNWDRSVLHFASLTWSHECLKSLLDKGCDPHANDMKGRTPLHFAAKTWSTDNVRILLKYYDDVCAQDQRKRMPLHIAAGRGNREGARLLLRRGADPFVADTHGRTPLILAAASGSKVTVKALLALNADVSVRDQKNRTALHLAAESGNSEIVKMLLRKGSDPSLQDHKGKTPLHIAAGRADTNMLQLLFSESVKIVDRDIHGRSLLHYAAGSNRPGQMTKACHLHENDTDKVENVNCVKFLTDKGFNPCLPDHQNITPLHLAAATGSSSNLKPLLEKAADPCAQDKHGRTPLHFAAVRQNTDLLSNLLEKGASPFTRDNKGRTPLHLAAGSGNREGVKLLLQKGADACAQDNQKRAVIHAAVASRNIETIKLLFESNTDPPLRNQEVRTPLSYAISNQQIDPWVPDKHGRTALHIAAMNGSNNVLRLLIEKGGNPSSHDYYGKSCLHHAATSGNSNCIRLLLNAGVSAVLQDYCGRTALHFAVLSWNRDSVQELLEKGVEPNVQDKEGSVALHLAARTVHVKLLLENGADPHIRDAKGRTSLHFAAQMKDSAVVKLLLEKGVNVNAQNELEATALHFATTCNFTENMNLLLTSGADPNIADKEGRTVLHVAAASRNNSPIKLLLEKTVNPNKQDKQGLAPIHLAAEYGNSDAVQLLLEKGADPCISDVEGNRPLHFAMQISKVQVVENLLEKTTDVNVQNNQGYTPLHMAAQCKSNVTIKLLLEKDANSSIKADDGKTALHLAARSDNSENVKLLLEAGVDPTEKDNHGRIPIDYARECGNENSIQLLTMATLRLSMAESRRRRSKRQT